MMLGDRDRGRRRQHPPRFRRDRRSSESSCSSATARRPVKRFRTGDDVRHPAALPSATKTVPKPVFGFAIEHLGGATVTAPCTRDVGLIPDVGLGRGHVDVDIENVVAAAGHLRPAHIDHRLQPPARLRQPAPRAAVRRDDRQAVRDRGRRHDPTHVDVPPMTSPRHGKDTSCLQ